MTYTPIISLLFVTANIFAQQKEFGWLIGTWQETGKQSFEVWRIEGDFLSAESYSLKDDVKKISEEIKLIRKGNEFFYVPDIAGPQGPVEFKITSYGKDNFIAKNPTHDFPKKIAYEKIDDTHLKATIGDASKTISYTFVKIK